MVWFGGDPQTQEAYGGSTQPLQDAVDRANRAQRAIEQSKASDNGGGKGGK